MTEFIVGIIDWLQKTWESHVVYQGVRVAMENSGKRILLRFLPLPKLLLQPRPGPPNVSFHRFPTDESLKNLWKQNIPKQN